MRRIRRPFTLRAALVAALVAAATVAPMGAQPASAGPIGVSGTINLTGHYVLVFRDWNINADRGTEVPDTPDPFNSSPGFAWLGRFQWTPMLQDWDGLYLAPGCIVTFYRFRATTLAWRVDTKDLTDSAIGFYIKMAFDEKAVVTRYDCVSRTDPPPPRDAGVIDRYVGEQPPPDVPSLPVTSPMAPAYGIGVKRDDYNRDGISDIVAVRDGLLHRWKGIGGGGFTYIGTYGPGWDPYAPSLTAVGDINRDGVGDLVAVRDDCLHRWLGDGNFGFTYIGTYGCGWGPYAATLTGVGDINRDGVADLVAVRDDVMQRWLGDGNGGFNYAGDWGPGWTPYAASLTGAGDMNGDGNGDLVAVRDGCLHKWVGNGSGGFNYVGVVGCGWGPYAATLTGKGDINSDGGGDLLSTYGDCLHRWYNGAYTYAGTWGCGWGTYPIQ